VIIIVITRYEDFLVLLVQFVQFGEMLGWISKFIRLTAGKATTHKMSAKPIEILMLQREMQLLNLNSASFHDNDNMVII